MPDSNIFKKITILPTSSVVLQFARYLIVGGSATVVDFSIFLLCHRMFGMNLIVSNTMGFIGGLIFNYMLSTIWVFDNRNLRSKKAEFIIFAAVGLGGLAISHALIYFGVEILSLLDIYGKTIAVAGALIWNFGIRKILLFREPAVVAETTNV